MNVRSVAAGFVASALFCSLPIASQAMPEFIQMNPTVIQAYHDVSLPLRAYPIRFSPRHGVVPEPRRAHALHFDWRPDPVVQDLEMYPRPLVGATIILNFDGILAPPGDTLEPPDPNSSVGDTQVVETVKLSYQVFNKATGASEFGPAQIGSIFSGMSSTCGLAFSSNNYTDPIVVYDKAANRWVVTVEASTPTANSICVAVSGTSDATGTYNRYDFGSVPFPDYPKWGVWRDGYYGAFDTNNPGGEACAFDRSAMLIGANAISVCFQRGGSDIHMLPSDIDGSTLPNSGEPAFFVEQASSFSASFLNIFQFHVDFTTPSNSTFTGPVKITVPPYTDPCGSSGICVPQLGVTQKLDSLSGHLMNRLAYRNFGSFESLVVNHPVKGTKAPVNMRWYEIRNPLNPVLYQSGTLASGKTSLWMGSIAMDKVGDMAFGFSDSSTTIHPGIQFTGRVPGDPLGKMESIASIIKGTGSQNGGDRWGDYSSMSIDPSDDCTFWYTNEWEAITGNFNWRTRLASLKFSGCH
jgi:hypothetical protein